MKKPIMALFAFVAFAGFAAADPVFSAEGGVYFDMGYDADIQSSGFNLGVDKLRFKVDITDKKNVEKGAEGDEQVYGDIKIEGLRISTDNDTANSSTYVTSVKNASQDWGKRALYLIWDQLRAKIVVSPEFNIGLVYNNYNNFHHALQLSAYNGDGYYLKNAYDYQLYNGTYGAKNAAGSLYNAWETEGQDGTPTDRVYFKASNYSYHDHVTNDAYLSANYSLPQVVDLTAMVASYKSYDDATRDSDSYTVTSKNAYTAILTATQKVDPNLMATVATAFDIGTPDDGKTGATVEYSPVAFSAKVGYKIAWGDDYTLIPQIAFDGQLPDADGYGGVVSSTDGFDYSIASGIEFDFLKSVFTLNVGLGADATKNQDTVYSLRSTAAVYFQSIENLLVKAAFEFIDDNLDNDTNNDGKVDSLDVVDATYGVALEAEYAIPVSAKGFLTPYGKVSADTKDVPNAWNLSDSGIPVYVQAGATLTGVVTNTKFDLYWHSNDLSDVENATKGNKIGEIVLRSTISF